LKAGLFPFEMVFVLRGELGVERVGNVAIVEWMQFLFGLIWEEKRRVQLILDLPFKPQQTLPPSTVIILNYWLSFQPAFNQPPSLHIPHVKNSMKA
jgi:hypothetical protein